MSPSMDPGNHEAGDTRILAHLVHALNKSFFDVVHGGDIKDVVILLSNFHHITAANPSVQIWISFKSGRKTTMISLNAIVAKMGKAMSLFTHSFDQTYSFQFKDEKYCCKLMHEIPNLVKEFAPLLTRHSKHHQS